MEEAKIKKNKKIGTEREKEAGGIRQLAEGNANGNYPAWPQVLKQNKTALGIEFKMAQGCQ